MFTNTQQIKAAKQEHVKYNKVEIVAIEKHNDASKSVQSTKFDLNQQSTNQLSTNDEIAHVCIMICALGVSCLILAYIGRKVYKSK